MAKNDITGDSISTKVTSDSYRNNFDNIFKKETMTIQTNDFDLYQRKAMAFRLPSANHDYALLNLCGEVGELFGLMAKAIRDGAKEDYQENIKKELGDILWCLAAVSDDYGYNLADVAQSNIDKLASRKHKGTIQGSGDNR